MRDVVKILLAVVCGALVALTITLPITLKEGEVPDLPDEPDEPDDLGAQRFPDTNFVTFDNVFDGRLTYKSFGAPFSAINPEEYICVSDSEYYRRRIDSYVPGTADYDKCDGEGSTKITKDGYKTFQENKVCSISSDEKYILCFHNIRKQWRHSFYADYFVYDVEADTELLTPDTTAILQQAQYCGWAPQGHSLVCVSNDKNLYVWTESETGFNAVDAVTTDGGWCMDSHRIMDVVYTQEGGRDKCIFNGVPDWNYEEEMISGRNTIYWSPDSKHLIFIALDVSEIHLLEYSVYPEHLAGASPDEVVQTSVEQYPRLNQILYAKTAGSIAKSKLYLYNLETKSKSEINTVGATGSLEFEQGIGCTDEPCEIEASQEHRYITRVVWSPDSLWFTSTWSSRDATQSKTLACSIDSNCKHAGREDGGVKGHWAGDVWVNEENSNKAGWVGSFGPFRPVLTNTFGNFFSIHSKKTGEIDNNMHAYNMSIEDGYWNVVHQSAVDTCAEALCGATWLTDSTAEKWVVTSLNFMDHVNNFLYFTAARGKNVGSHEVTEQRKRHVFRVKTDDLNLQEPECVTCTLDETTESCASVSVRRNCDGSADNCSRPLIIAQCSGPSYPRTYMTGSDEIKWNLLEDNRELKDKDTNEKLSRTKVEYGIWKNNDYGTYHNYEMFVPEDFDEHTTSKKYAIFLEVYAGPEFQKIQGTYKRSWPQVHLPSAYDCITLSVDGRGSAFQGDIFMFSNYKALGQTERVDQTEFIRWFINEGPYAKIVDKSRVSVYGWSYGGYTTTNIIGYGGGSLGKVFSSGVSVAPLADWRFYDAMYAERYMGWNGKLNEILEPHWVNASMIERNLNENKMENFRGSNYHLIHGTDDDNVHFLSSAQMEKALVANGIDFENFYYADEDHSIRSTTIVNKHVYRNIITRIVESWGYKWNGKREESEPAL